MKAQYADINLNILDLQMMIHGIETICDGLTEDTLLYNTKGILETNPELAPHENAYNFVATNYDLIQGLFTLIGACTSVIGCALSNGDIEMVPGSPEWRKQSKAM